MQRLKTVLFIDDSSLCCAVASMGFMLDPGYQIFTAINVEKAMEIVERHYKEINLIVSDVEMDLGLTGLHLFEMLQSDERYNHIPFMLQSGFMDESLSKLRHIDGRLVPIIYKPYAVNQLIASIKAEVEKHFLE